MPTGYEHGISRKQTLASDSFSQERKYIIRLTDDDLDLIFEDGVEPETLINQWMNDTANIPFFVGEYVRQSIDLTEVNPGIWEAAVRYSPDAYDGEDTTSGDTNRNVNSKPKPGEAKLRFRFNTSSNTINLPANVDGLPFECYRRGDLDGPNGKEKGDWVKIIPPTVAKGAPRFIGEDIKKGVIRGVKVQTPQASFSYDFTLPENYVNNPTYLETILKGVGRINDYPFSGLDELCVLCTGIQGAVSLWDASGTIQNKYATLSFEFEYIPEKNVNYVAGVGMPGTENVKISGYTYEDVHDVQAVDIEQGTKFMNVEPKRLTFWQIYPTFDFRYFRIPGTVDPNDYPANTPLVPDLDEPVVF